MSVLVHDFDRFFASELLDLITSATGSERLSSARSLAASNGIGALAYHGHTPGNLYVIGIHFVRRPRTPIVAATFQNLNGMFSSISSDRGYPDIAPAHVLAAAMVLLHHAYKRGSVFGGQIRENLGDSLERGIPAPATLFKNLDPLFELRPGETCPAVEHAFAPQISAPPANCWYRDFMECTDCRARELVLRQRIDQEARIQGRKVSSLWDVNEACHVAALCASPLAGLREFAHRMNAAYSKIYSCRFVDPDFAEFIASDEAETVEKTILQAAAYDAFFGVLNTKKTQSGATDSRSHLEMFWSVEKPNGSLDTVLVARLHLTTERMTRCPRNTKQLRAFYDTIIRGQQQIPQIELAMLKAFLHKLKQDKPGALIIKSPAYWTDWLAPAALLFWADTEQPVHYTSETATVRITETNNATEFQWNVILPDGTRTNLTDGALIYCEADSLKFAFVRTDNRLMKLDMAAESSLPQHRRARIGTLPLEELEKRNALRQFTDTFAGLFEPLKGNDGKLINAVPVQAHLTMRCGKKCDVSVGAFALNHELQLAFSYHPPRGWKPCNYTETVLHGGKRKNHTPTEDAAAPLLPIYVPDTASLADVQRFLTDIIPERFGTDTHSSTACVMHFSTTAYIDQTRDFITRWSQRPADLICYGDAAFDRLVTVRRAPKFKVAFTPASGIGWFDATIEMDAEELLNLEEAVRELERQPGNLVRLADGRNYARDDIAEFCNQTTELLQLGIDPFERHTQRVHALQLQDATTATAYFNRPQIIDNFFDESDITIPTHLAGVLRSYQETGIRFIIRACRCFGGTLLADDMGLGKTLQVLAAISILRKLQPADAAPQTTLVVCPASVMRSWRAEAARFLPELRVLVLESGAARRELYADIAANKWDIIVTNYALARGDEELLLGIHWLAVCADEAQVLKNPESTSARVLRSLRAEYRMAITGTPMENHLLDLWSIMQFAIPGFLPSRRVWNRQIAITGETAYRGLLRTKLKPVLVRRLKEQVAAELPPRIEEILECEMESEQKRLYHAELKRARKLRDTPHGDRQSGTMNLLASLMRLRQIACHPGLVLPAYANAPSGKLSVLVENVREILDEGHKVLIFSQFVQMLNIIQQRLQKEGIPYRLLTGDTPTATRATMVADFENSAVPEAFLISLKAGGVGLNLVSASYVIIYDPWWNPAVEAQAIDRTHRIGQHKNVVAMRLVSQGTIEERVLELQQQKRETFASIFETAAFSQTITHDDLRSLLD